MANFATVENGIVTGRYDLLPENTENVSGFNTLIGDEETLNSHGWYTVQKIIVAYDPELQYIESYIYSFIDGKVYETPQLGTYLLPSPEEKFNTKIAEVRAERDRLITECDWTQLSDVQSIHDEAWKTAWTTYRQSLRDLPNLCISGELNIYDFTWPTKP
jgi:hypothetical protein